uniref:Uncharacterized protein n=1 Tax=Setaria italica TaxID=4555 RepID=K3YBF2_SETIT
MQITEARGDAVLLCMNGRIFENQPATNMSRMVSSIMEEGLLWCVDQGWSEAGRPRMACCMTAISSTTSAA